MLSSMLLSVALVPAQIWTVDDDGPADFPSIAAAIPLVAAGDVLLVQPGTYGPFQLDKSLSILAPAGAPRPLIVGTSTVTGTGACSFVRLKFHALALSSIAERMAIDDCELGAEDLGSTIVSLTAEQCSQVLVTRTSVQGPESYGSGAASVFCAVHLIASEAAFVGCNLAGGDGPYGEYWGSRGGTGLRLESSTATVAGTDVSGGNGGNEFGAIGCGAGCGGPGGHAIWAAASELFVRGSSSNTVQQGYQPYAGTSDGYAIFATDSLVVTSAVPLVGPVSATGGTLLTPSPAEPFLLVTGDDSLGLRRILVYGPPQAPAFAVLSVVPALLALPTLVEGSVWLDPSQILLIVPLVLHGQDMSASFLIEVPDVPSLAGLTAVTQAVCPSLPGTLDPSVPLVTNAGQMVLH